MNTIIFIPAKSGGHFPAVDASATNFLAALVASYDHTLKLFQNSPITKELMDSFEVCEKILKRYFDPFLKEARKAQNQLVKEQKEKIKTLKTKFWNLIFNFKNFHAKMQRELKKA